MKERWTRLLAVLLALALSLTCCLSAAAEGKYPTQWDLTEIYASVDEWQADYDRVMEEMLPQIETFRGTLNTAQGICDFYQFSHLGELTRLENKLYLYAYLGTSLNPADPVSTNLMAKINLLFSTENRLNSFVNPEIFALPLETREEILADPLLAELAYFLRDIVNPDREPLSEETNTVLAILAPAMGKSSGVYDILYSVEIPDPLITMPDGEEAELTDVLYNQIIYSDAYDRDFKSLCNQVYLTKLVPYVNTFAALLEMCVGENWAAAQINHYDSSREAALAKSDVDPAVYDMLVEAAHRGAPDYQRYLNVHKRGLGLDVQYPFDTAASVSDYNGNDTPYDDAVEQVREALSILGEDYIAIYDEIIQSGHLDVYPTDTKTTGAFSISGGDEFLPYMLFNYAGIPSDVSTLAHEMGHSVYSYLSAEARNAVNENATTFTHEVASTTNELLYYTYKMEHAATQDERLFYLEKVLFTFGGSFFMQTLYAEFEDEMYRTVEAGGSLDAETLSDRWAELYLLYRGDAVKAFPDARYQWSTIPHFYLNYYVYQYATSVAYAASIAQRIMNGEEGAVDDYLSFLKLGGSMSPVDLLSVAGVDPLKEETYQLALDYFSGLVDTYEQLVDAKLAAK